MEPFTYLKPNGEWGIEGVDLSTLPPRVYRALCRLRDLEHPLGASDHQRRMEVSAE